MLAESLSPILRDLAAAHLEAPEFKEEHWTEDPERPSVMAFGSDGSGRGIAVQRSLPKAERIVDVADQVQEWVIEGQLWGAESGTNWPSCRKHPRNHPLEARVIGQTGTWCCPIDGGAIAVIGG